MDDVRGFTLLELMVVIAIIGVVSAMTLPNIGDWLAKRRLQSEYHTLTAKMETLRLKARTLPGTARLQCANGRVTTEIRLASGQLIESDPPVGSNTSLLQYPAQVLLTPCNGDVISFASDGATSGTRQFDLYYAGDSLGARYGAYRLNLSGTTGFIRRYRLSPGASAWLETE